MTSQTRTITNSPADTMTVPCCERFGLRQWISGRRSGKHSARRIAALVCAVKRLSWRLDSEWWEDVSGSISTRTDSWAPIQNLIDSVPEMDGSRCRSTRASWCRRAAAPVSPDPLAHGPPRNRARSTIARVTLPSASRWHPADSASTANSTLCPSCRTRRARRMTTSPIRLGAR